MTPPAAGREGRDEQVQRLAQVLYDFRDAGMSARDAAAAILDCVTPQITGATFQPPVPPQPVVVVSEEARRSHPGYSKSEHCRCTTCPDCANGILAAAFPHLLRDNPAYLRDHLPSAFPNAVNDEIRRRIEALGVSGRSRFTVTEASGRMAEGHVPTDDLIRALCDPPRKRPNPVRL